MRFRATAIALAALTASILFSWVPASAQLRSHTRVADAPVAHTLYLWGATMNAAGHPSILAGVASVNVDSSGVYSGTLATAGDKPATLQVTGTLTATGMTLATMMGGQQLSVQAMPVVEPIGDRGSATPSTTAGNEFRGAVMLGSTPAGYVTAMDSSIMRGYGFAAAVKRGRDRGTVLNGSLFTFVDAYGDMRGYLLQDGTSAIFPATGAIGRGQMFVHINLFGSGQVFGTASASRSIIARLTVYKGAFSGPRNGDLGAWLGTPPES